MDDEEQAILDHFDEVFSVKVNEHIKDKIHILKVIYDRFAEILSSPNRRYFRFETRSQNTYN